VLALRHPSPRPNRIPKWADLGGQVIAVRSSLARLVLKSLATVAHSLSCRQFFIPVWMLAILNTISGNGLFESCNPPSSSEKSELVWISFRTQYRTASGTSSKVWVGVSAVMNLAEWKDRNLMGLIRDSVAMPREGARGAVFLRDRPRRQPWFRGTPAASFLIPKTLWAANQ
jgi:hypothetical protein